MGSKRGKHLKIGLLISEYYDEFIRDACEGAMRAAEEMDTDLYLLAGGYLKADYRDDNKNNYEFENNSIFEFGIGTGLDALIIFLDNIAKLVCDEVRSEFLKKFGDIPMIIVASEMEGYSSIVFDNKGGFAHGVEYLVKEKGCKKIGYVSGPETSFDANQRLDAYREVLAKYNLPCEDKQIVYGNFSEYSDEVVQKLLDANPDLDAIAFANYHMAKGGYRFFEERGIAVGTDLAVIGFDDSDFAKLLTPSLTTTKADAKELGYQSLIKMCDMLKEIEQTGEKIIKKYRTDTSLIIRESCGGRSENLVQDNEILDPTLVEISKLVNILLFKNFDYSEKNSNLDFLKEHIYEIIRWMNINVYDRTLSYDLSRSVVRKFNGSIAKIMTRINETSSIFDLVQSVFDIYMPFILTENERLRFQDAKAEIYRNIQITVERKQKNNLQEKNILQWIMMDITRDTNGLGNEQEKYRLLLKKMHMLNIRSSFIMLYPQIAHCVDVESWVRPEYLTLKSYQKGEKTITPKEEFKRLPMENLFVVADGSNEKRKTLSISVLFSGYDQYGVLAVETTFENLLYIEPIRFQISSAIQTMNMFKDMEKMTKQLEINLLELKESNAFLDEVSKSDELTQIYNRRGFLVTSKKIVRNEENYGKKALFIYADMNNLKLVNDQFGHEEGDYSLKAIADILKAALGDNGIVGRMGGDEFAAFMLADEKQLAENAFEEGVIRRRITEETEALNQANDKPYYVSLSAGMRFFTIDEQVDFDRIMADADADLYQWKKVKRKEILK